MVHIDKITDSAGFFFRKILQVQGKIYLYEYKVLYRVTRLFSFNTNKVNQDKQEKNPLTYPNHVLLLLFFSPQINV